MTAVTSSGKLGEKVGAAGLLPGLGGLERDTPAPHLCWLRPTQTRRSKSAPSAGPHVLCTNKKVPKFVSHFFLKKKKMAHI